MSREPRLTLINGQHYAVAMEVHLSPEQQARLSEFAERAGKTVEDIVLEAIVRMLDEEVQFSEAAKIGLASLDGGQFVEHAEVKARVNNLLGSYPV